MTPVVVDSNVLLDVFTDDPVWGRWSASILERFAGETRLVLNPIIYAEVSVKFENIADLDAVLPADYYVREELPWDAAFLAGKCHLRYRRLGGTRTAPLPDFFIGAHAAVRGYRLLTRDGERYKTYFPRLDLIAP